MTHDARTPYERLGETKLRAIMVDFVSRVRRDMMIGFFFRDVDPLRLAELEYQMAARMLGASVVYHGRPLGQAHRKHRIMGGQFARRRQILLDTLRDHQVDADIVEIWLQHTDALRPQIIGTSDACN